MLHVAFLKIHPPFFFPGVIGNFIPSLVATFTAAEDKNDKDELGLEIFSDEKLKDVAPVVIVNILKNKNVDLRSKYENEVVWRMFPVIQSKIFAGGIPKSDYWDTVRNYLL